MNQDNKMMVVNVAVDKISPNPYQPRKFFDDDKISSLAESIRQYGVMQPIVLTKKSKDQYELISGERRWRASKLAGLQSIPAIIRDYEHSNEEKFELAIIENVQREDLNPVDKAKAFKKLTDEFGLTHSQIASKLGKSREYISNSLRLLALPDTILDVIARGDISEGHSKPLLMLNDRPYEQQELLKKIINNNLTVRAAIQTVRSLLNTSQKSQSENDPDLAKIEKKLAEKLGTKVHIDSKKEGDGGKLTIEYFSKKDLEKIVNLVRGQGLSTTPILESNDGLDNFNNNFQNLNEEKIEPQHFKEEIKKLENNSQTDNTDLDDFNISSFNKKNTENNIVNVEKKEKENQVIDNFQNIDQTTNNLDNFIQTPENNNQEINNFAIDNFNTFSNNSEQNNKIEKQAAPEIVSPNSLNQISEKENSPETITGTDLIKLRVENNLPAESINSNLSSTNSSQSTEARENIFATQNSMGEKIKITEEKKTEAQKRINAILSGSSKVADLFPESGLTDLTTAKIEDNIQPVNPPQPNLNSEAKLSNLSVYENFLKNKEKITQERKEHKQILREEEGIPENKEEFAQTVKQEKEKKELEQEKKYNPLAGIEEEFETENIFAGSDFVPKPQKIEPKITQNNNEDLRKNPNSYNNNSGFGTFSI